MIQKEQAPLELTQALGLAANASPGLVWSKMQAERGRLARVLGLGQKATENAMRSALKDRELAAELAGAKAERERIFAILDLPDAANNRETAIALARSKDVTTETAASLLASLPTAASNNQRALLWQMRVMQELQQKIANGEEIDGFNSSEGSKADRIVQRVLRAGQ